MKYMSDNRNEWKVNEEDVAMEISVALADTYNAKIIREKNMLVINFENGQSFKVEVSKNN
jgi:hypothetical protein